MAKWLQPAEERRMYSNDKMEKRKVCFILPPDGIIMNLNITVLNMEDISMKVLDLSWNELNSELDSDYLVKWAKKSGKIRKILIRKLITFIFVRYLLSPFLFILPPIYSGSFTVYFSLCCCTHVFAATTNIKPLLWETFCRISAWKVVI